MFEISLLDLKSIATSAGLDPERAVWTRYSGKFMYGQECVGFTVEGKPGLSGMMRLGAAMWTILGPDSASLVAGAKTDDMGLDTIVYFPTVQVSDE